MGDEYSLWSKYPELSKELNAVEEYIKENTRSKNALLSKVTTDLVGAGGKRLRPALTLICAGFGGGNNPKVTSAAGALEILHSATLVHDDIIDRTSHRRGRPTVAEKFGVDMAVYVGDFLFTKAVLMLSKNISIEKLDLVARSVTAICEGEVYQYRDRFDTNTSVLAYLKRIRSKTAVLFGAACGVGAYCSDCPEEVSKKLARFGFYYGMAFQIRDDLNDIISDFKSSGKPVLNDISQGTITLPVIYSLKRSREIMDLIKGFAGKKVSIPLREKKEFIGLVKASGGIDDATILLEKYIERGLKSIAVLPDTDSKQILTELITELKV